MKSRSRGRIFGEEGTDETTGTGCGCACGCLGARRHGGVGSAQERAAQALRILNRAERPLIVGGLPAAPGTFGMMAFVVYEDSGTGDLSVCSGTVVSPQHSS